MAATATTVVVPAPVVVRSRETPAAHSYETPAVRIERSSAPGNPPAAEAVAVATPAAPRRDSVPSPSAARAALVTASQLSPAPPRAMPLVQARTADGDAAAPPPRPQIALPLALPAKTAPEHVQQFRDSPAAPHASGPLTRAEDAAPPKPATAPSAQRGKLGAREIGRVAERVYQLLVDRLAQERQRRGA
jgi:hypothetical protein